MGVAEVQDALFVILADKEAVAAPRAVEICVGDGANAMSVAALVAELKAADAGQRFVIVYGDEPIGVVDVARADEIAHTRSGEAHHLMPLPGPAAALPPVRYVCAVCARVRVFAGVMVGGLVRCRFDGIEMTVTP